MDFVPFLILTTGCIPNKGSVDLDETTDIAPSQNM